MLEYMCPTCNVPMETSECAVCNEKTIMSSTIYWCDECNIPIYDKVCPCCGDKSRYISRDIRPVFPKERLLLGILKENENPLVYMQCSVWNGSGFYFIDGEKLKLPITELNQLPMETIKEIKVKYDEYVNSIDNCGFEKYKNIFVEVNKDRYNQFNEEAVRFIQGYRDKFSIEDIFVSFSGGKDSTVTSHLVRKAMGTQKILHIFGDTTLEFEKTLEYKERFKKCEENRGILIITAKNVEKDFNELCDVIGPPSRVMRWCCTVFKTGAISKKIEAIYNEKTNILSFQGIRRSESTSRSKYDRESDSPKIAKQTVASPIIDWLDFDVWLYILTENIDFNEAYELGFSRVGCWCCPNNGSWSEFLAKVFTFDAAEKWRNQLIEFAKKIEKPDPEEYIDSGNWKARQGGNGLEIAQTSVVTFEPCALEENAYNYILQKPITEDLYELFKPFGFINKDLGYRRLGEIYVLNRQGSVVMILQGRIGTYKLKVILKDKSVTEGNVVCQITKYQMCINCKACVGVCKLGAITVHQDQDESVIYRIDDKKCVRCKECVAHFNAGCYMRKVLTIKRG